MPFTRESLLKDIELRLDDLSRRIKGRTGTGLNDAAKFLEPFAARLLNAAYGWDLKDPAPGVPNTKGIDLTDDTNSVAVQVSVQESAEKIKHTKDMVSDGKFAGYTTIAVFFLHRVNHRDDRGLRIINISDLIGDLMGKEPSELRKIVAILDDEIAILNPDDPARKARLATYLSGLVTGFQGYNEIGIEKGKEGEDESPPIWKIFVPPACTQDRAVSPAEMEAAQNAASPTTPAVPLLPLLADDKNRRHVLLGDPGMGKSTLIQRLTAGLASGQGTPSAPALDSCLPIPLILRDVVPHLPDDPAEWNWTTLCDTMRRKYQRSEDAPGIYSPWSDLRSLREELFNDPRAFFLVDGLDEIGDTAKRIAIRDAIWEGFRAHPDTRWLVTSRTVGYDLAEVDTFDFDHHYDPKSVRRYKELSHLPDELEEEWGKLIISFQPVDRLGSTGSIRAVLFSVCVCSRLYLAPFDDAQQDRFVKNWFRERKEPNQPPGLLGDIRARDHEGIRVLARVPNLLSYMAILRRGGKPLPDGRAELYMAIAHAYLHGIDKAYRLSKKHGHACPIPFKGRLRLLAILAGEMQHRRAAEAAARVDKVKTDASDSGKTDGNIVISEPDVRALLLAPLADLMKGCDAEQELTDFLSFIVSRSGLLLERGTAEDGSTLFGFTHLSFLEFFAACYLKDELEHEKDMRDAASDAGRDSACAEFQSTYLADFPRGPRKMLRCDLPSFADQAEWHEAIIFLAEFTHDAPRQRDILLRQLFPSLHNSDLPPIWFDKKLRHYKGLMSLSTVVLTIRLARDSYLELPTDTRRAWFTRLWDAFLAWRIPAARSHPWPANALLLDHPTHEPEALLTLQRAASRHADIISLSFENCHGFTDATVLRELWPKLQGLSLVGSKGMRTVDTLPASLTALDLSGCTSLNAVNALPASLNMLWLNGCIALREVNRLPLALTELWLNGCSGLCSVDALPASLTVLWLDGCTGLTSVDLLPASLTMLWLEGCTGLTSADALPVSLTELGLQGCTGFTAEAVARIKQALPECEIFELWHHVQE